MGQALLEVRGIQRAAAQIVLVKDRFGHSKRRPCVPTSVLVEQNGNDDPCADVRTAPLAGGGEEFGADLEVVSGHWAIYWRLESLHLHNQPVRVEGCLYSYAGTDVGSRSYSSGSTSGTSAKAAR